MNILPPAVALLASVVPPQPVVLVNRGSALNKETLIYEPVDETMDATAHVQPQARSVESQTAETIDAPETAIFWLVNLTPELVDFVRRITTRSSQIVWGGKTFTCIAKSDWALNGWVKLTGVWNDRSTAVA